jgi:hypothetical protein
MKRNKDMSKEDAVNRSRRRANMAQSYYCRAGQIIITLDLRGEVANAIANCYPVANHPKVVGVVRGDRGEVYDYMHRVQVAGQVAGARVTWEILQ